MRYGALYHLLLRAYPRQIWGMQSPDINLHSQNWADNNVLELSKNSFGGKTHFVKRCVDSLPTLNGCKYWRTGVKIYSIKNICVEMQIYLCFDKIQMEWLVYCAHEHVDRLFSVKRQRYIWCLSTFNNSTNVRHFPVQLMLLSLKAILGKSKTIPSFAAFSSIRIWYILLIYYSISTFLSWTQSLWNSIQSLKFSHFHSIIIKKVLKRFSRIAGSISDCCNC